MVAPQIGFSFLGRHENRWQVRLELGFTPRGVTVGLVSEDGQALGPAMVAPPESGREPDPEFERGLRHPSSFLAELAGPCPLPGGTVVRCTLDTVCGVWVQEFPLDPRRGLHAFLLGDSPLAVESLEQGIGLSRSELRRLAGTFPWLAPAPIPCGTPPAPNPESDADDEMLKMLADDFGVDVEELDPALRASLRNK